MVTEDDEIKVIMLEADEFWSYVIPNPANKFTFDRAKTPQIGDLRQFSLRSNVKLFAGFGISSKKPSMAVACHAL